MARQPREVSQRCSERGCSWYGVCVCVCVCVCVRLYLSSQFFCFSLLPSATHVVVRLAPYSTALQNTRSGISYRSSCTTSFVDQPTSFFFSSLFFRLVCATSCSSVPCSQCNRLQLGMFPLVRADAHPPVMPYHISHTAASAGHVTNGSLDHDRTVVCGAFGDSGQGGIGGLGETQGRSRGQQQARQGVP